LLIDGSGQVRLELDSERRPIRVLRGDADCRLAHCREGAAAAAIEWGDVIVAPSEMKLRAAIALKRQTQHPIVLVDQMGRLAGLCGDEEIYRALLRKD
jgi:glycine betaine/proline transport system ATP-binding protein